MKHDFNVMKADCADNCQWDEHKEERPARLGSEIHTQPQIPGEQVPSSAKCSAVVHAGWPWFSLFAPENWSRALNKVTTRTRTSTRTRMNSQVTWILILLMSPLATLLRHQTSSAWCFFFCVSCKILRTGYFLVCCLRLEEFFYLDINTKNFPLTCLYPT